MKNHFILFLLLVCASVNLYGYDVTVAKDGSGNYTTVQAAVDAAPTNRTTAYTIYIKNGKYKEKITVASNKTFLQFIGESVANVILTYDDYSGKLIPGGGGATYGTSTSASVTINAPDFTAINITFENTTGDAPQALAINVNNDRCAFKNCRFLGGQDTLLANNAGMRQYYNHCYIDGTVDFIFGNSRAVFDDCTIYPKDRVDLTANSYITAANTPAGQAYGYVFRNCFIAMNRGITKYYLGRPWQNASTSSPQAENRVSFLNTKMGGTVVNALGWSTWDAGTVTSLIHFEEYQSVTTTGTAVDVSSRVGWSKQLNATEAGVYTNTNLFTTWNPCTLTADFCPPTTTSDIAVSNFKGVKGATTTTFTWNASWGIEGVNYALYRSIDNQASFQKLYEIAATDDTNLNFGTTDPNPPSGSTYYYYILASKTGLASHTTDIVSISSTPTITVGTTGSFLQGLGTPSAPQYYALSGVNLIGDVLITPPANYQISLDAGATWSSTPLSITPVSNAIVNKTVGVRLNSMTIGGFSGNIVHTSTGATDANVAVTGSVQSDPLPISVPLLYFPLTTNNADDAATRATGVTTTIPTLSRLTTSTSASPTAYSTTFGQALCPIGTTNGLWSTATANGGSSDGTGGNLSRTHYEQFTLTAAANYSVRVDSFTLTSAFYNTSSNTKLAVVYSKTGFTTADSTNVTGGIAGATGAALAATANGAFTTPILLSNQTGGTTINYRLALNNSTGVTLDAGQTLTVRIYFACGSTGVPRYAMVKDVYFKGLTSPTIPLSMLDLNVEKMGNNANRVKWTTADEKNVKQFDIERSTNGQYFRYIGTTQALGNTKTTQSYDFIDEKPFNGVNYYRLKMVDIDGVSTLSKVIVVDNKNSKSIVLKTFPNPVHDQLTIVHQHTEGVLIFSISDAQGQKILSRTVQSGEQTSFDVHSLPNGVYFVECLNKGEHMVLKFVKQ